MNHVDRNDEQFHEALRKIQNLSMENVIPLNTCQTLWVQVLYEHDL
jgi:hypothetical protein